MFRLLCILCLLALVGCTIGDGPRPVTTEQVVGPLYTPPPEPLPLPPPTAEELVGLCADVPRPTPVRLPLVEVSKPKAGRKGKALPALAPAQVIAEAQKAASVEPTALGFFGSGEQSFVWHAGEIYKVYLHPQVTTGLFLPPGERQISGLRLDSEKFDVEVERSGKDAHAYDSFRITPKVDIGEYKTPIITESGRRYLLHFVIVKDEKVGMAAVSFELQRTGR